MSLDRPGEANKTYEQLWWTPNDRDAAILEERDRNGFPRRAAPNSVLIASLGANWEPGCRDAVVTMANETANKGYWVSLYQVPDLCYQPYDALGTMRNTAYVKALIQGWEYLLLLNNDVVPQPDTLLRLMNRHLPIVAPAIRYRDEDTLIGQYQEVGKKEGKAFEYEDIPLFYTVPQARPDRRNKGLALAGAVLLDFVLFKSRVFMPWATGAFFQDAIGAGELYHWEKLDMVAHNPWLDTDVVLEVVKPPHFPLDRRPDKFGPNLEAPRPRRVEYPH